MVLQIFVLEKKQKMFNLVELISNVISAFTKNLKRKQMSMKKLIFINLFLFSLVAYSSGGYLEATRIWDKTR